ncbi:hypothetical protein [Nocardia sp. NPDC058497]|uniref:hypothetical protein n=1 Tax=Nocardia sp. NPDC058497 TaxID=3346529 RepID=UPI00365DDDEC
MGAVAVVKPEQRDGQMRQWWVVHANLPVSIQVTSSLAWLKLCLWMRAQRGHCFSASGCLIRRTGAEQHGVVVRTR